MTVTYTCSCPECGEQMAPNPGTGGIFCPSCEGVKGEPLLPLDPSQLRPWRESWEGVLFLLNRVERNWL